jgi:SpoVK/Ycf46/Vps4 family AAA+-type ATPase
MSTKQHQSWHEKNQRHLAAALETVRELLERHGSAGKKGSRSRAKEPGASEMNPPPALEKLCNDFELTAFERQLLLLCAGTEMDARFAALCAAAHGDPLRTQPTFSLALAIFPEAHWTALSPDAALRRWKLIEVGAGDTLTSSPLRIDERVLHFLAGVTCTDERLRGLIARVPPPEELAPSQKRVAVRLIEFWSREIAPAPLVQLCGNDAAGRHAVAAAACAALGLHLVVLRAADLPTAAAERELLARLWERETLLTGCALLLDGDGASADALRSLAAFAESVQAIVAIDASELLGLRSRPLVRLEIARPAPAEQHALWRESFGEMATQLNGELERVAAHFDFGFRAIRAASAQAIGRIHAHGSRDAGAELWEACRSQARPQLDVLAQRIDPAAMWGDIVLPPAQTHALRQIAAHVRQRLRVYESWGFSKKSARGLGVSALFSGASGTGKTMAAEVLANELRLDLYRIDLSAMVSKYIGDTEKNLRRVFDAAEESGAILLFDEADALFGKRSEVKDSHDRYANIEISYLLQRVETYRGLAILTTNMKNAIDGAFLRRIRFIVHFPFPDAAQRVEIWRRIFPRETPTEGLEMEKLARLNLAGGNIRNLALNAAFLAADLGEPVRMRHLLAAAQSEYAKLEKPLSEAEIGGWT